jgi:MoxR-like ATPase
VTSTPVLPPSHAAPGDPGVPASLTDLGRRIVANVQQVVHGRERAVELVTCALLAGGHALIEDVPGSGKTTMARAFARSLGGVFQRIQATADLLPTDITGSGIWEPDQHRFVFVPGPLFAHVVLADELNRTPPRTQSAFLEAMDEGAVTVDGVRHALPDPFFVVATQNPLEQHGTYPLPEGQLDRFAVCLRLGDLDAVSERLVVREQLVRPTVDDLQPVVGPDQLRAARAAVRQTYVADPVLDHALALVQSTRHDPRVLLGASPRAALTLIRCAQARAHLYGRDYVAPDDTKALAAAVLGHRLLLSHDVAGGGPAVVADLVERVPVPLQG